MMEGDTGSISSSNNSHGMTISSNPSLHTASSVSSGKGHFEQESTSTSTRNKRPLPVFENYSTESGPVLKTKRILSPPRRISKQDLIKPGENNPWIYGMSYNSARDELFLADNENGMVRAIHLHDNSGDLHDVFKGPVYSVCHVSDSDTTLVCSYEPKKRWLVALSSSESKWSEADRVLTEAPGKYDTFCRALSKSRVLVGEHNSTYMELFRVDSGSLIKRLHRVALIDSTKYRSFTVSFDSDPLVSVYYRWNNFLRIHRLLDDRLEELTRFEFESPCLSLWLPNRILATEWHKRIKSNSIIELELCNTQLKRLRVLVSPDERVDVWRWSAVDDGFVVFDFNSRDILYYCF